MTDELNTEDDGREGLPSASGIEQLVLCPGSWLAQKQVPKLPPGKDAEQGTRLHECMEKGTNPEDEDEREAVAWCKDTEAGLVFELFNEVPEAMRERRLWDKSHGFSGKADVIYIAGASALILDYKFGRNAVAEAGCNWQLATLAVVLFDNFPQVQTITAGILQPYASRKKPQLVQYSPGNVETARRYIEAAIANAKASQARLRAGEVQCRYCRAASTCPAVTRNVQTLAVADFKSWEVMTPVQKRELWDLWKACEKAGKKLAALISADLDAGKDIPGLSLTAGKKAFEVTDPARVFQLLAGELGITGEEFTACCKVGISGLDKLVHAKLKAGNEKQTQEQSRAHLRERLEAWGCGKLSVSKGSIQAKGGAA